MKILITGGHLTPAVAFIQELQKQYPHGVILFVGREYVFEGEDIASEERETIEKLGVHFFPITTGRSTGLSFLKLFRGFFESLVYLLKEKPDLIVSFGGYVALPLVIVGYFLGIPALTHEQTRSPGKANRIISTFAKKIAISYSDTNKNGLSEKKIVLTGLPIRHELFIIKKPKEMISLPFLFIVGGATGAESINNVVFASLPKLLEQYSVVHQVGKKSYAKAVHLGKTYTRGAHRYMPRDYIEAEEYGYLLRHAKIVIGRSGANTTAEIQAVGQVAIFIPLPWSSYGEQEQNAMHLVQAGSALLLTQSSLRVDSLLKAIQTATKDYDTMKKNALDLQKNSNLSAARNLVAEVVPMLRVQ